ncbi:protein of unknown function [Pseudorhizobium banfieldiae]|uniref:Terminase small subunit n=1 Tax=Pseudorhizobium banfieldiae TaxID=1125847 RepID=L0NFU6_9HYPH|nr:hypothetical protein [Pseudorhizobium banfieldiae]CAD6606189.1 hypothetical protein RNT25_01807 [arsenite-oxidising bacterium NT-25]CCF19152.1 protein of unknown function [Pseudorhizobium banfieldiae]
MAPRTEKTAPPKKSSTRKPAPKKPVAEKKPKAEKPRDDLAGVVMSTQGMAAVLGVTPRWLQSLVKDGTIPSLGRGRFDPTAVFQAYAAFLKEGVTKKTGNESLDELRKEKALTERLNRERKDRTLIELDEALGVIDEVTGMFVASLNGLPAQITGVPRERQRLNDIFDSERLRLADRFAKKREALRSGREDPDAEAEDDAD